MKFHPMLNHKTPLHWGCALAGAWLLSQATVGAQTFTYTNTDLIAGFRQSGGSYDLVVNLGSVSAFESLTARSVTTVANLSSTQLADALGTVDDVTWSVFAAMRGNPAYTSTYALQTFWATSPRLDIFTTGPVWTRQSQWTLGGAASQIEAIGSGAALYAASQASGDDNTTTGIVIPSGNQYSYTYLMGSYGDLSGTFQGNIENTTADDFDSAGLPSRSVLYKLAPSSDSDAGTVLGFFDFKPNGTLTFTAGPPPERVNISKISTSGGKVTLSFATTNLVGYRLRYTDSAGLTNYVTNWTSGGTLIGDGGIDSLQDSAPSASPRFYSVESYY